MNLEGKVAIITGGAKGIGRGITEVFLKEGAKVAIIDYDNDLINLTKDLTTNYKDKFLAYQGDVTNKELLAGVIGDLTNRWGDIDILVNNAGIAKYKAFLEHDDELLNNVINVNIKAVWELSLLVIPSMLKKGKGSIINVSSVTGPMVADPGSSLYALSKSAVLGLTKSLAIEFAPKNIRVNAIQPGAVLTPLLKSNMGDNPDAEAEKLAKTIPMGRLGDPKEIGELAAFLASDRSSYITGTGIVIDGGSTLPETNGILR